MATAQTQTTATTAPTNGSAAIQAPDKPKQYANSLHAFLDRPDVKAKLEEVAKKFLQPEDLIRLALTAASRSPDLLKCSPESVLRCLMEAAAMNIVPGGMNGRGYLIPRNNKNTKKLEACFDPGWRGLEDIAKRSGKVTRIEAHPVYAADKYKVTLGDNPSILHEPDYDIPDRGPIKAGYAVAYFADGSKQGEPLSRKDIDKIKAAAASQSGPWSTWEEEMVRKSAVRRLCKHLPIYDPIMEQALALTADGDDTIEIVPRAIAPGNTADLEAQLMGAGTATAHDTATGEVIETTAEEKKEEAS